MGRKRDTLRKFSVKGTRKPFQREAIPYLNKKDARKRVKYHNKNGRYARKIKHKKGYTIYTRSKR